MKNLRDYLTIGEAAELLGVCEMTLRRWDNSGKLKAYRHPLTKYRLYRKNQLEKFLRKLASKR